ncbi:hypothetical protein LPA44_04035 [Halobacterium sp. KA-4]|uniref:hypothetical protein n=1 Tax=Halobacterium sp. KA-4 TaxID=2896367 RepID=UPI001E4D41EA|nr:hypothetical protein [Halobacterium sp. KA-4]MCD2199068.1 hypothetical protein [Halobacterium sp. KA-4]
MTRPEPTDLPPFIRDDTDPASVVDWLTLVDTRPQLMERIGQRVGFHVEPADRDRLDTHELALIAAYILALEGEI